MRSLSRLLSKKFFGVVVGLVVVVVVVSVVAVLRFVLRKAGMTWDPWRKSSRDWASFEERGV